MNQTKIKLSKRLNTVASFLPKGTIFADIGSDHGYLPCYVCLHDPTARAIAGEVNKGPYQRAVKTVRSFQLEKRIDVRLGNGLAILQPGEVSEVVIAGMGGPLIRTILEDGEDQLLHVERIITQPNVDARGVRHWLTRNGYFITQETIVEENGHYYEIIVADKQADKQQFKLSEKKLLFGPKLLERKGNDFRRKWRHQYKKHCRVVEQMKRARSMPKEKIDQLKTEMEWIREVLGDV
ncbi:MAG TPA: class I SAM-dependent methyltransferase [Bacillota bacterium]